ncbi:hypothetical protein PR048_030744 [Dryococelus australis]|uniref:Uncharacterized protein n=1 Tax=Dryococelus australis TaxID=614101 RepID=A0ABQ9GDM5_9NEOP|nr:hypothetical protein PR048_030744 [Dryococelus australis]
MNGRGETGDHRENPPTNNITRHDSHLRKIPVTRPGIEPGSPRWEASVLIAQPPCPQNPRRSLAELSTCNLTRTCPAAKGESCELLKTWFHRKASRYGRHYSQSRCFSLQTPLNLHACIPPTANRVQSPAGSPESSQVGLVTDDAVGRRVFSGISRFPSPFIPASLHVNFHHPHRLSTPRCYEQPKYLHSSLLVSSFGIVCRYTQARCSRDLQRRRYECIDEKYTGRFNTGSYRMFTVKWRELYAATRRLCVLGTYSGDAMNALMRRNRRAVLWRNFPDLVKLCLPEAEGYAGSRTLAGFQKRRKCPWMYYRYTIYVASAALFLLLCCSPPPPPPSRESLLTWRGPRDAKPAAGKEVPAFKNHPPPPPPQIIFVYFRVTSDDPRRLASFFRPYPPPFRPLMRAKGVILLASNMVNRDLFQPGSFLISACEEHCCWSAGFFSLIQHPPSPLESVAAPSKFHFSLIGTFGLLGTVFAAPPI